MKVLHLLQSSSFSGAENVVCQIVRMMQAEPDIEMVYCSPDGPVRETLREQGVRFAPVKALSGREVRRVLREQKPDVIHAHDMRAGFAAALFCGRIPLISHIHNNSFASRGVSVKSTAYLLAGWRARHIFWVSQSAFDGYAFHGLLKGKSSVLHNVIDTGALYQKMNTAPTSCSYDAVYIGRLAYPKNPQRLMEVFRLLAKRLPAVKIAVIGAGDLETETKRLAEEYNLSGNVSFLGFQPNPLKILHSSKAMVMTSRWEGMPMCALEAMALGVPIVSTPTDGLTELVRSGENGYLSSSNEELADRLAEVIGNETLRKRLSAQILADAKRINNIDAYRNELLKAYRG